MTSSTLSMRRSFPNDAAHVRAKSGASDVLGPRRTRIAECTSYKAGERKAFARPLPKKAEANSRKCAQSDSPERPAGMPLPGQWIKCENRTEQESETSKAGDELPVVVAVEAS